jgi:hypothetical protein
MLVEALDSLCHGFGKTHHAGDLGPALTAGLHQLARHLAAVLEGAHDGAEALCEPSLQSGMGQHEAERLRQAAVDQLEIALEDPIIGKIELADAGGIAAAADVLQEQGVVEFRQVGIAQADLPADMHSDPAAAHAMPSWLAFGQIERMAERA